MMDGHVPQKCMHLDEKFYVKRVILRTSEGSFLI
jgi:hypothetical protein